MPGAANVSFEPGADTQNEQYSQLILANLGSQRSAANVRCKLDWAVSQPSSQAR